MRYKKTPPPRDTAPENRLLGGPKTTDGLPDEDNYEIQVWESENGKFLGYAVKTAINGVVVDAWKQAIEKYPGKYLAQTNGNYLIRDVVAPSAIPDKSGWTSAQQVTLAELPQWYGLIARCSCGYRAEVDRYDQKLKKWFGHPLETVAEKLSCRACRQAGRTGMKIEIGIFKLAR